MGKVNERFPEGMKWIEGTRNKLSNFSAMSLVAWTVFSWKKFLAKTMPLEVRYMREMPHRARRRVDMIRGCICRGRKGNQRRDRRREI